jgi:Uma2 family endonuclease
MATTARLTLEEYLKLPETKPYSEFVDGEVRQKPMPSWGHGVVERLLSFVFTLYLRANPVGDAGSEIRCILGPAGNERAPVPDYVFVTGSRLQGIRNRDPFRGAPDLAVEILSPDDRMVEVLEKIRFYLTNGVRLVWLINPYDRTVTVFTTPTEPHVLTEDDTLAGGEVLPGFSTPVREILPPPDLLP